MKVLAILICVLLLSSCSIFKHREKNSHNSESDSSSATQNHSNRVDTSSYSSYKRWSFLLPQATFGKLQSNPFSPVFKPYLGNAQAQRSYLSPWLLVDAGLIPVVFEQYDTGKKGVTETKRESTSTQVHKEDEALKVESTPDYSWIPYLIGTLAVIVFAGIFIRRWS